MGITAGIIFLAFALGGISFFFSYLFDRTNLSIALGAGIPTFFLLVRMLHNASPKADVLRYSAIFSLHEPLRIAQANPVTLELLVLGVPGIGLSVAGMRLFTKKNFHYSVKSVDRSLLSSEVYVAYPLSIMQPPTTKRNPLVASMRLYQFLALDTRRRRGLRSVRGGFYLSDKRHLSHAPSLLLSVKSRLFTAGDGDNEEVVPWKFVEECRITWHIVGEAVEWQLNEKGHFSA